MRDPYDVKVVCHDNRLSLDAKTEISGLNSRFWLRHSTFHFKVLLDVFWNSLKFYDRKRRMVINLHGNKMNSGFFCLMMLLLDVDRNVCCCSSDDG